MRFDAYSGNFTGVGLGETAERLSSVLKGTVERAPPRRRFRDVLQLTTASEKVMWLASDRANDLVFFEIKGEQTPDITTIVRSLFPQHLVLRADVCEDFNAHGAFELLVAAARKAKPRRVTAVEMKPDDALDGRTWGCGVRNGSGYLRIYEKGKQRQFRLEGHPDWLRVEFEIKPQYRAEKLAAAQMAPEEIVGIVPWCATVAGSILKVPIPRHRRAPRRYGNDTTQLHLARAYRRFWKDRLAEGRDWHCIGLEIEDIWAHDDRLMNAAVTRKLAEYNIGGPA